LGGDAIFASKSSYRHYSDVVGERIRDFRRLAIALNGEAATASPSGKTPPIPPPQAASGLLR
jgi:hypothetical protein